MKALISIIMSVYNGERYLKESINSILSQSYKCFEFIIIDDFSSDDTLKIIESFNDPRIIIIRNKSNIGLPASLNKGVKLSSGKYIARQDDDDISEYDRLQKQLDFMQKSGNINLVFCRFDLFDGLGKIYGSESKCYENGDIVSSLQEKLDPLAHGAVMVKKESLIKVKCYDERFIYSQDYELWNRMIDKEQFKVSIINYVGYHHRIRYSGKKKWQARYTNLVDKRHVFGRHVYNKNVELLHKEVLISKKNERIFDKIFNFVNAYYFYIKIRFKSILIACKFN
jgi:glycosyltransferase involved in cell wall biosynthesis